jgi:hypothetical protein
VAAVQATSGYSWRIRASLGGNIGPPIRHPRRNRAEHGNQVVEESRTEAPESQYSASGIGG